MKFKKCDSCGRNIEDVYYEIAADRLDRKSNDQCFVLFYAEICERCFSEKVLTILPEDKR